MVQCSVCMQQFDESAVIKAGDYRICAQCKPIFLQRLREGASLTGAMKYGGFWIRFTAVGVDGLVAGAGGWIVGFALGFLLGAMGIRALAAKVIVQVFTSAIGIAYITYFLGAYGATLGKMLCGLRVVRSDGRKISYGRAFGRYWANFLSAITFSIGYIMAAFDSEKRALHDRICDTRVVRT